MNDPISRDTPLRDEITADLRAGGALAHSLPGYQERPAQIAMARLVSDAVERGEHVLLEASTGTGKSLAYLLPIVRSGKVAIVSTANKALQEQLFYKDIPFIQQHIQPFSAALVKGMGNYLCLDRFEEQRAFQQLAPNSAVAAMEEQLGNYDRWNGDLDNLAIALTGELRGRVSGDADQCAWRACPHFGACYVREIRDRARAAQIIVVNHTLLLLDAEMGGFLLPERDLVVIDEAQHLEEEATRAFTAVASPARVQSLLAQHRLRDHADPTAQHEAMAANANLWDALEGLMGAGARDRQLLTQPLQEGLRLAATIETLGNSLEKNRPVNMTEKDEQLYERLIKRARTLAADLRTVFGEQKPDERVYFAERSGRASRRGGGQQTLSASAAPLSVAEMLREKLFDKVPTVATSATLAVGGSFAFYRARVGLAPAHEAVLPLTFDYARQALLYVPRMRLEPAFGAAGGPYLDELAREMRDLVAAAHGRAFLLFNSQRALSGVLERIREPLAQHDYVLLVQGEHLGRIELLRQFRARERAVLLGLKSFWEGVDVAGEALSLVVIDKLPFDPPDDPVHEARVNHMKAEGENWFGSYVLPQAILRLKQGIGRLLRASDDRGVLAILDKRLYTKGYGAQVLAALPPASRTADIRDVRAFFAAD